MRDAGEIDGLYQHNIRPLLTPLVAGTVVVPVSCVERHRDTTAMLSIPKAQQHAYAYAMRFRPEHYYTNLMPGLPLWLLWTWSRLDVPCTAVIRHDQLTAFPDMSELLHLAWDACVEHITVDGPDERDGTCRANGTPITVEHVLHKIAPDGTITTRKEEV